jgi:CubicO group peptidase (beta-lactamase class C family)
MNKFRLCVLVAALACGVPLAFSQPLYYPGPGQDWEVRPPEDVGMSSVLLDEAVAFAIANETRMTRELTARGRDSEDPYDAILGPQKDRAPVNGILLRHGYIVAEWGETRRVDMAFSVTKSFLSTVAGVAVDRGLIRDVMEPVKDYAHDGGFDSPQNSKVTWHQLLNMTSEWQGTLWSKPDWAHSRPTEDPATWPTRQPAEPGSRWEYNDVRVNRLALSLLRVWRRPLPQVLLEYVMDPIGASRTWEWHGYENSWVTIDGLQMQSVSGGGHWGGGLWISARDMARFGLLTLRNGRWNERQVLSEEWVEMARTPTPLNPNYGYMNWFLNTDRREWPSAPEATFCHIGAGTNAICVISEYDVVAVVRWIDGGELDEFLRRVIASVNGERQ